MDSLECSPARVSIVGFTIHMWQYQDAKELSSPRPDSFGGKEGTRTRILQPQLQAYLSGDSLFFLSVHSHNTKVCKGGSQVLDLTKEKEVEDREAIRKTNRPA